MRTMLGLMAAGSVMFLAAEAGAADVKGEIVNAETHAGLAAKASDIDGVHMHLHHALNCLVGPGGMGYDAKQMNPCANSGAGAIPDTTDAAKKKSLEAAADTARKGIAAADLAAAQKAATDTATMLKPLE